MIAALLSGVSVVDVLLAFAGVLGASGGILVGLRSAGLVKKSTDSSNATDIFDKLTGRLETRLGIVEGQLGTARERIDHLETTTAAQTAQLATLRENMRMMRGRYLAALQHIREWRYWAITLQGDSPDLPGELVEDVTDPPRS